MQCYLVFAHCHGALRFHLCLVWLYLVSFGVVVVSVQFRPVSFHRCSAAVVWYGPVSWHLISDGVVWCSLVQSQLLVVQLHSTS